MPKIENLNVIYRAEDGTPYIQPVADIVSVGTLIDPHTGDDLSMVGYYVTGQHEEVTEAQYLGVGETFIHEGSVYTVESFHEWQPGTPNRMIVVTGQTEPLIIRKDASVTVIEED